MNFADLRRRAVVKTWPPSSHFGQATSAHTGDVTHDGPHRTDEPSSNMRFSQSRETSITDSDNELFDLTYPASKSCVDCRAAKQIAAPEFKEGQGGAKNICLRCGYTYLTDPRTEGPIPYPSEIEPGVLATAREEHEQLWVFDDSERTTLAAGRIIEYVTGWRAEGIATGAATQPADFQIQYPLGAVPLAVARSTSSHTPGNQQVGHPNQEDDDRPVFEVVMSSILTQANDHDVIANLEDSGEVFVWAKGAIYAASTQLAASPEDEFESSMRLLPQLESHVPGAIQSLWVAEDPDTAPNSELNFVWQWRPGYGWTPYDLLPIRDRVQAILGRQNEGAAHPRTCSQWQTP